MQLKVSVDSITVIKVDTLIAFVTQEETTSSGTLKQLDGFTEGAITTLYESEQFNGEESTSALIYPAVGFKSKQLLLVGLGESSKVDQDCFRRAIGSVSRHQSLKGSASAAFSLGKYSKPEYYQAVVEGCLLGKYRILDWKSGDSRHDSHRLASLTALIPKRQMARSVDKAINRGTIIAEGQILARDLSFTPSNMLTPVMFAKKAQELARKHKLSFKALDQQAIEKEKMGAYLSVTKGSTEPPRFVILQYKGAAASQKPIVLVGKGVMFDSGGISLKAGLNMHEMKQDMTGAAVVLSTIVTAARLGIKRNIVALVAACENMPAGNASKPGDVVTARNGKTIEIINTDAEGRLTLADALDYANKFDPQAVIDIATLTGAALYILGYAGAPITGNNKRLLDQIEVASLGTGEHVWQMPLWDEYRESMKGDCADLVNAGVRAAGTLCAAAFLENFIGDWPWAHVDIAYMDNEPKGRPYLPKGATGWGVRLLTDVLENWKKV